MRAQCCICSDLFEDDGAVSALPCGHTFHEHCINQWLNTANTCPSCRVGVERAKIIKKLFFDKGDEEGVDHSKLSNENNHLKAKLREKDLERENFEDQKRSFEIKMKSLEKNKKELESKVKEEQTHVSSLRKQCQYFQTQQKAIEIEREQCQKAKRKMIELQNIQTILTGCETDVQELLGSRSHSEGSTQEFAKYCAILKSEYEQLKTNRRALKSDFDKIKKDLIFKDSLLKDSMKEVEVLKDMVRKSEKELQNAEIRIEDLQKKVSELQNILKNPCNKIDSSFMESLSSPVISTPDVPRHHRRSDIAPDCLAEMAKPSPNTQLQQHCKENNVKVLKITSASNQPPSKKQKCDDLNSLGSFNIFKKKSGIGESKSAIRKGYDGLGGHMTFTERQSKPKFTAKRSVSRTNDLKKARVASTPKFPSLDSFISID